MKKASVSSAVQGGATTRRLSRSDHLVGAEDKRLRKSNTECVCRLEIKNELEFRRLLHRKIGRLCALQPSNAVRWDKAKNPIFWTGTHNLIVIPVRQRLVPDDCLANGICGLDYCFWRYRIPL